MALHPFELLRAWQARALPIVEKMAMRGRGVDWEAMEATLALIPKVETGAEECFSEDNRRHSHHMPGCPWKQRGTPATPAQMAELRQRVAAYRIEGGLAWGQAVQRGLNRWFTGAGPDDPVG